MSCFSSSVKQFQGEGHESYQASVTSCVLVTTGFGATCTDLPQKAAQQLLAHSEEGNLAWVTTLGFPTLSQQQPQPSQEEVCGVRVESGPGTGRCPTSKLCLPPRTGLRLTTPYWAFVLNCVPKPFIILS